MFMEVFCKIFFVNLSAKTWCKLVYKCFHCNSACSDLRKSSSGILNIKHGYISVPRFIHKVHEKQGILPNEVSYNRTPQKIYRQFTARDCRPNKNYLCLLFIKIGLCRITEYSIITPSNHPLVYIWFPPIKSILIRNVICVMSGIILLMYHV